MHIHIIINCSFLHCARNLFFLFLLWEKNNMKFIQWCTARDNRKGVICISLCAVLYRSSYPDLNSWSQMAAEQKCWLYFNFTLLWWSILCIDISPCFHFFDPCHGIIMLAITTRSFIFVVISAAIGGQRKQTSECEKCVYTSYTHRLCLYNVLQAQSHEATASNVWPLVKPVFH